MVTSPTPQHARTNARVRGWRAFRLWRRTRPFWGGLFTMLSGLEIFATTQGSLGGLSFQMGPTGFLSWLIPTILVACGLLMWVTPAQRLFYAIVAAVTAVFSLIGVNLGGFLVGLLLGMVGSALGFAWTPIAPQPPEPAEASPDGEPDADRKSGNETTVDNLLDGSETPPQRDHWRESDVDATREIPVQRPTDGRPQLYVITVLLLSLAVAGLVTLRGGTPAHAAPCPPTASPTAPGGTPTPTPSTTPTPSPVPADGAERDEDGNLITDILEGIGDLIGIGGGTEEQAPAAEATPTPTPSGTKSPEKPAEPTPTPTCPPGSGAPGEEPGDGEASNPLVKRVPPPADIQAIGRIPSIMTGTKLTNENLKFVGVTDLPVRGGGTMEVLWFDITKATTENFELQPAVPGNRRMSIKAKPLTVEGHVRFFTPRFVGNLLGLKQVYTPKTPPPLPPGLPIPLPIIFTDIDIQLAYIDCDKLTADELRNTP